MTIGQLLGWTQTFLDNLGVWDVLSAGVTIAIIVSVGKLVTASIRS